MLIKKVFNFQTIENSENQDELFRLDIEVSKMDNEIRSKGAHPVGPLIQYSGTDNQKGGNIVVIIDVCISLIAIIGMISRSNLAMYITYVAIILVAISIIAKQKKFNTIEEDTQ